MINIFLPDENAGFFGTITHWCFIGFLACFLIDAPTVAGFLLLFCICGLFLMLLFD